MDSSARRGDGTGSVAALLLGAKALRAFADGFVSVLLPVYLLRLGFDTVAVGAIGTATLLGSGAMTLGLSLYAGRLDRRRLLIAAALLMAATGASFAAFNGFWPLALVAVVGTLNPSSGDVSVFLPLEHALLAGAVADGRRTAIMSRYALVGYLFAALGALAAGLPDLAARLELLGPLPALKAAFLLYGAAGLGAGLLYRRLPSGLGGGTRANPPLGPSRDIVYRLAALFSLDAFAGGFIVQSLLALWLFDRFHLSVADAGAFFFWTGLLSAGSQLAAPAVAARFGLVNTMVFTHLPSSIFLIGAALSPDVTVALGLLSVRALLSQMDVPTRSSYVMAVVTPEERPAAAGLTAVPRSLASAIGPMLAGGLMAASGLGTPLIVCGTLKIVYDLLLLTGFRRIRPPEERPEQQA